MWTDLEPFSVTGHGLWPPQGSGCPSDDMWAECGLIPLGTSEEMPAPWPRKPLDPAVPALATGVGFAFSLVSVCFRCNLFNMGMFFPLL